jgi:serpin B
MAIRYRWMPVVTLQLYFPYSVGNCRVRARFHGQPIRSALGSPRGQGRAPVNTNQNNSTLHYHGAQAADLTTNMCYQMANFLHSSNRSQKRLLTMRISKNLRYLVFALLCQSIAANAQPRVADNSNAFALEFYKKWSKKTDKNIVLSPFSISAAIGMTYPGARNITASQMKTAMRFHSNLTQQNQDFHKLVTDLNAEGSPMVITNTLWMQKGFTIESNFLDVNAKYFGSNFRPINFAGAADSSRMAINSMIEKQTKDKIKDLLPAGSVNSLTRMVLTNAIYFKGVWAIPFDPEKTKDRDFFVSPGNPVKAKFMELEHVTFSFFENDLVKILELPYSHPRFSMLILLPKGNATGFDKSLSGMAYASWNFRPGKFGSIQLPKFKIDHEVQPVDILKQFGMTDAFQDGKADFSGISKETRLFISGIFHKAFIEVNEEGTEAAAATAVVAQAESAMEPQKELDFIVNRPFLFILRDRITNSILFIGKVKDPR